MTPEFYHLYIQDTVNVVVGIVLTAALGYLANALRRWGDKTHHQNIANEALSLVKAAQIIIPEGDAAYAGLTKSLSTKFPGEPNEGVETAIKSAIHTVKTVDLSANANPPVVVNTTAVLPPTGMVK